MWSAIAYFILKFRLYLIIFLFGTTAFMGYMATKTQWSFELFKAVPDDDKDMVYFKQFQNLFGEDGNVMAIAMEDSSIYKLKNFKRYYELVYEVSRMEGITSIAALPNFVYLHANAEEKKFETSKLFQRVPKTQQELDSMMSFIGKVDFYDKRLIKRETGATLAIISLDGDVLNSPHRNDLIQNVKRACKKFEFESGIKLHYAGLPFVRSVMSGKVKAEVNMFLILSVLMAALVMFLFFRSVSAVFYPLLVVGMVIVWTIGTMGMLGFKFTALTGLLPSILTVIGIPNCIYLLNKFHHEFVEIGQKKTALANVIKKIGIVTLITNTTTAIGFFVLNFTAIAPMQEFGLVATINIFAAFFISITFIPAIFSYLPSPKSRHTKHLDFKATNFIIDVFIDLVQNRKWWVFGASSIIIVVALYGTTKLKALTYMVDDLPKDSEIMTDLKFFEKTFGGIMPIEFLVDTGKEKGFKSKSVLKKIDKLEAYLESVPEVTAPLSFVTFLKAANQSYNNYRSEYDYKLPGREAAFINRYIKNSDQGETNKLAQSYVDPTGRYLRVSAKVADIGSLKMDELIQNELRPQLDSIFNDGKSVSADVTGTTFIFIKSNEYLISNLKWSMIIAFGLIAIIMGILFKKFSIVIISLIPNIIPLIVTAAIMGFLGISLKPSTALVFSIAFGISVDDSIHFLAKYRQELLLNNFDKTKALIISLRQTGSSMIYTSVVLFGGFIIFTFSSFGGTIALGGLTSVTLIIAMFTNLILLPTLLNAYDKPVQPRP